MPLDHSETDAARMPLNSAYAYGVRRFGAVNWLGLWTLYQKEVRRYLNVATQTVLAPIICSHYFGARHTDGASGALENRAQNARSSLF